MIEGLLCEMRKTQIISYLWSLMQPEVSSICMKFGSPCVIPMVREVAQIFELKIGFTTSKVFP